MRLATPSLEPLSIPPVLDVSLMKALRRKISPRWKCYISKVTQMFVLLTALVRRLFICLVGVLAGLCGSVFADFDKIMEELLIFIKSKFTKDLVKHHKG